MKKEINITCSTSNTFYLPTTVMLTSVLENNKDVHVNIFIISQKQTSEVEDNFRLLEKRYDCSIKIIYFDLWNYIPQDQESSFIANCGRYSEAIAYSLFVPELLPEINRTIYLDSDLIVNQPLSELYNCDLGNHPWAACGSNAFLQGGHCTLHMTPFLPRENKYVNAGVMLLDLAKMRVNHISDKLWDAYTKNIKQFLFKNQDAYCYVMGNDVLLISQKWNFRQGIWYINEFEEMLPEYQKEIKDIIRNKDWAIVHFSYPIKPWDRAVVASFTPMAHLWWKYLRLSPYASWERKLKDVPFKQRIKYQAAKLLWNLHVPVKFRKQFIAM